MDTGAAKFDLDFEFGESMAGGGAPAGMTGTLDYSADLFDPGTAESVVARLLRLLEAVVADQDLRVHDIELLDAAERSLVLREWGGGELYVLDSGLRPVPPGVYAEVYEAVDVPGEGMVADPFGRPGRWLRPTGERGRWTPAGELVRTPAAGTGIAPGRDKVPGRVTRTRRRRSCAGCSPMCSAWTRWGRRRLLRPGRTLPRRGPSHEPRTRPPAHPAVAEGLLRGPHARRRGQAARCFGCFG
ncbi:hypothetical protein NKH18_39910 [Streptomyces sp. M10(2022)]